MSEKQSKLDELLSRDYQTTYIEGGYQEQAERLISKLFLDKTLGRINPERTAIDRIVWLCMRAEEHGHAIERRFVRQAVEEDRKEAAQ